MKKTHLLIALAFAFSLSSSANAQDALSLTPKDFKQVIIQMDGLSYYDNLGIQMSFGQDGNIKEQLLNGKDSDSEVYDKLQSCQRLFSGLTSIPLYVASYYTSHFGQYSEYYAKTLSKSGNTNDAAAAFLLLTTFNGKCKSVLKDYESFCDLMDNFSEDSACKIIMDKKHAYNGSTLMILSITLANKVRDGSIESIPSKTKSNLIKAYENVLKECEKALKKNNTQYNEFLTQNKDLYTLILNKLK